MWEAIVYYGTLTLEAFVGVFGIRLYEEAPYEVLARPTKRVEVRRYGSRVAVQIRLPSDDERGRNEAFQILFAYIAGANRLARSCDDRGKITGLLQLRCSERVAMTVPVKVLQGDAEAYMQFFLPIKYTIATAPRPLDKRLSLVERTAEMTASLRFGGVGHDVVARQAELIDSLKCSGWRPVGRPYTLFYDAPFTLPFLRRTEVAVSVFETR